ncbi:MAG TPA: M24 family metallopeptidase [Aggregatilineales bacterium]|nr:aminopeptidase P family protein [Anaerolineales bacterium]HRE47250.1 M24 family metallopeptidase [Aggregatilineales bacterium]
MIDFLTDRAARKPEVDSKLDRLRARMVAANIDALHITQNATIAWLTAGALTYIHEATDTSPVSLLVTMDHAYALTDTIEMPRLRDEQGLEALGFEFVVEKWYDKGQALITLTEGKRAVGDSGGGAAIVQELRSVLSPDEVDRFRYAGHLAADAMDEAIRATQVGDSELLLAGRMTSAARARGGISVVNLVASDERVAQYRHPLPARKSVDKYAMLVMCFRYEGLVISLTRFVFFGAIPSELKARRDACARVDTKLILGTHAGRTLGEMFEIAKAGYAAEGFPEAIEEHHQGGSAGYAPREVVARPGLTTIIQPNQAFAWNPSIRGVKSEDTILLTSEGVEILTAMPGFPTIKVTIPEGTLERPDILQM